MFSRERWKDRLVSCGVTSRRDATSLTIPARSFFFKVFPSRSSRPNADEWNQPSTRVLHPTSKGEFVSLLPSFLHQWPLLLVTALQSIVATIELLHTHARTHRFDHHQRPVVRLPLRLLSILLPFRKYIEKESSLEIKREKPCQSIWSHHKKNKKERRE